MVQFLAVFQAAALLAVANTGSALAHTTRETRGYPAYWIREAQCVHHYEADHDAPTDLAAWPYGWHNRSNRESRGGMQFLYSTWASAVGRHHLHGYPADPADASVAQQLYVAWLLYLDDGRSWHEWSTAAGCGLT